MGVKDFKPDNSQLDEAAPIPVAPVMPELPTIEEDQAQDETEDAKLAAAYWHPAWAKVQKLFEEKLESYDGNNVMQYKDLPPTEFQVKVLAQQTVYMEINNLMEDVKRAVESVEQRPKPAKRSKSGG